MPSKPQKSDKYETGLTDRSLRAARYIFFGKVGGAVAVLLLLVYIVLQSLGRSLKEEFVPMGEEAFFRLAEKERARYRQKVRLLLEKEMIRTRSDTVLVIVQDPKYLLYADRGVYQFPEERNIYGCRIHALELAIKRSLFEMQFPFVFTRVVLQDSLGTLDTSRFHFRPAAFPMYISKKLPFEYSGHDSLPSIRPLDSLVQFFNGLYEKNVADRLYAMYVGEGPAGEFKEYAPSDFLKLSEEERKAVRRAFLALSEADQNRFRRTGVGISNLYGCFAVDEEPGPYFPTLIDRKLHELQVNDLLSPYLNMATFSLQYPTARVYNVNFEVNGAQNTNSLLFIALKSGRAPAHYTLERKDCPRILQQGMFYDITDYLLKWDQFKNFPKFAMTASSYPNAGDGHRRCYFGVPGKVLTADAIQYRRDWLEEPGIIEWVRKKGWIHPADKLPYIPPSWTWDDFRTLAKLMTDNDPAGRRKGFVERPSPFLYLESKVPIAFEIITDLCMKPNPTQQTTWKFFDDNPVILEGLREVHDMYWIDKSVRSGVEVTYSTVGQEFSGGKAGIAQTPAHGVPFAALMFKNTLFGPDKDYGKVVGLTGFPGSKEFPSVTITDCSLLGFNPYLSKDQFEMAFEWIREFYYGEFVNNSLLYQVKESRILGSESVVFRNALASPYAVDYSRLDVDPRAVFPKNYVDYFDNLRSTQHIPSSPAGNDFGFKDFPARPVQDEVFLLFQRVLVDSMPDYERIIQQAANYINKTMLNFKDEDIVIKMEKYYQARLDFYRQYFPGYFPTYKERYEKYFKYW